MAVPKKPKKEAAPKQEREPFAGVKPVRGEDVFPKSTVIADRLDLVLAVDTLRSASIEIHKSNKHGGAYDVCLDPICSRAYFLWKYAGDTAVVIPLMAQAEAWLLEKVRPVAKRQASDGPTVVKTKQAFEGELAPGAPPMVIANVTESRKDGDDPGIPKDWERLDPDKLPQ